MPTAITPEITKYEISQTMNIAAIRSPLVFGYQQICFLLFKWTRPKSTSGLNSSSIFMSDLSKTFSRYTYKLKV